MELREHQPMEGNGTGSSSTSFLIGGQTHSHRVPAYAWQHIFIVLGGKNTNSNKMFTAPDPHTVVAFEPWISHLSASENVLITMHPKHAVSCCASFRRFYLGMSRMALCVILACLSFTEVRFCVQVFLRYKAGTVFNRHNLHKVLIQLNLQVLGTVMISRIIWFTPQCNMK